MHAVCAGARVDLIARQPPAGYARVPGELRALARVLERPVWVHSRDAPLLKMGEAGGVPLVVTYHRDYYALGEHYNSTEGVK